jgi:hypothetical protein
VCWPIRSTNLTGYRETGRLLIRSQPASLEGDGAGGETAAIYGIGRPLRRGPWNLFVPLRTRGLLRLLGALSELRHECVEHADCARFDIGSTVRCRAWLVA